MEKWQFNRQRGDSSTPGGKMMPEFTSEPWLDVTVFDHSGQTWAFSPEHLPPPGPELRNSILRERHDLRLAITPVNKPRETLLFVDTWRESRGDPQFLAVSWAPSVMVSRLWNSGFHLVAAIVRSAGGDVDKPIRWRLVSPIGDLRGEVKAGDDAANLFAGASQRLGPIFAMSVKAGCVEFLVDLSSPQVPETQVTLVWPGEIRRPWIPFLAELIEQTEKSDLPRTSGGGAITNVLQDVLGRVAADLNGNFP